MLAVWLIAGMLPAMGARPRTENARAPLITIPPATVSPPAVAKMVAPAPRSLLPTRLRLVRDAPGAGVAMSGALDGTAASAVGVAMAVFSNSEAFDRAPAIELMLADETDRRAQALFAAAAHGAPILGIAVAALDDNGGGVALLYDDASTFAASLPRLRQALAQPDAVEIGATDNSVCESETASGDNTDTAWADAAWDDAVAAIAPLAATGQRVEINAALTHALIAALTSNTGASWNVVPLAGSK